MVVEENLADDPKRLPDVRCRLLHYAKGYSDHSAGLDYLILATRARLVLKDYSPRSPQQWNPVRAELPIIRDQCHALGFRLRQQHSVERVAVMEG